MYLYESQQLKPHIVLPSASPTEKAYAISEELVKPCALEMTEFMCCKNVMTKLAQIPLSSNTILRWIGCMSDNIREQVCDKFRMSPAKASMQLDESTDVANLSQLLMCGMFMEIEW